MQHKQLPIFLEKDEDGMYIAECPALEGCYSQGATMDEALKNVQEAIGLCLEDKKNQQLYEEYKPKDLSFHLVTV